MVNQLEYPFNHSFHWIWFMCLAPGTKLIHQCVCQSLSLFSFLIFQILFFWKSFFEFDYISFSNKQATKQVWNVKKTTTIIDVGRIRLRLYPYHHQAWLFRFSFIFSIQKYERIYWTTAAAHVHYQYSIEEEENLSKKKFIGSSS